MNAAAKKSRIAEIDAFYAALRGHEIPHPGNAALACVDGERDALTGRYRFAQRSMQSAYLHGVRKVHLELPAVVARWANAL